MLDLEEDHRLVTVSTGWGRLGEGGVEAMPPSGRTLPARTPAEADWVRHLVLTSRQSETVTMSAGEER